MHVEKQPPVAGDDVGLAKTNRNILILLVLVNAGSQGLQGLLAPLTNELQAHLSVSLSTIATIQTCFLIAFALATPLWACARTCAINSNSQDTRHRSEVYVGVGVHSCFMVSVCVSDMLCCAMVLFLIMFNISLFFIT